MFKMKNLVLGLLLISSINIVGCSSKVSPDDLLITPEGKYNENGITDKEYLARKIAEEYNGKLELHELVRAMLTVCKDVDIYSTTLEELNKAGVKINKNYLVNENNLNSLIIEYNSAINNVHLANFDKVFSTLNRAKTQLSELGHDVSGISVYEKIDNAIYYFVNDEFPMMSMVDLETGITLTSYVEPRIK